MNTASRFLRMALLCAALVFAAWIGHGAHAQGTYGQLPDPISAPEVARLLRNYVHPSKEQAESIEALHDSYKQRFRALREGDIEKFLAKMRSMQGGMMPSKAQMDDFMKGYERTLQQIEDADDSFFEAIAALMGAEHGAAVRRAQDARTRTRCATGIMSGMAGGMSMVDLSAVVLESGLGAGALAPLDAELRAYEQKATAQMKDLNQIGQRTIRDMIDEMQRAGLGELSNEEMANDPEKMQQVMETMQQAMAKTMQRFMAKIAELNEHNGKCFRSLQSQLAGRDKRLLRARYMAQAYPELAQDPAGTERLFLWALRSKGVDAAIKEQVQGAYERWCTSDDALVEQGIKATDEFRATLTMMDLGNRYQEHAERITAIAQKRTELAESAVKGLAGLVGDERVQRVLALLAEREADPFEDTGDPEAPAEGPEGAMVGVRASPLEPGDSPHSSLQAASPIAAASVEALATRMGLDATHKVLATTIHADYAKRWDEELSPIRARIEEAQRKRWDQAAGDVDGSMNQAQSNAYYEGRRALDLKASALDLALFQDLSAALGDAAKPGIQLLRLERAIDRSAGDRQAMMFTGFSMGVEESPANFVAVLWSADLSIEEIKAVHAALEAQVEAIVKMCADAQLGSLDVERGMEEASLTNAALYRDGNAPDPAEIAKASAAMAALQRRRTEQGVQRSAAVDGAWAATLAALPEGKRTALADAYQAERYPAVFKDPRSAAPIIEKACQLADLTDEQRAKLLELQARYRADHLALCRKMVPAPGEGGAAPDMTDNEATQRYWQDQMERANQRERVRFDRDENSQRAVSQLRRILSEAQAQRIAALVEYDKSTKATRPGQFGQVE